MYAGNVALTHGRSPPRHLQGPVQNKQVAVDEVERVVEMAVDDARPPSDTGGDAARDVINTPIVETGGRATTPDPSAYLVW